MVLAVALLVGACGQQQPTVDQGQGGGGGGGNGAAAEGFDIQDAEDHGAVDLSGQSETSLELDDFYFEPTILIGEPGQTINIELENDGQAPHTFTTADGSVDEELQAGQSVEVDVTFPDSGALAFECRFHAGQGMIGALSVSGDLGATGADRQGDDDGGGDDSDGGGEGSGDDEPGEGPGY
jgi:plastocyanin